MLPFFRKIRWRLAQNNQFFKYSRYAIGEIALVVVGILIALQINNWNEEKKEQQMVDQHLKSLKTCLQEDRNWLMNLRDIETFRYYSINKLIEFAEGSTSALDSMRSERVPYKSTWLWNRELPSEPESEFIVLTFSWTGRHLPMVSNQHCIEELKNSGLFSKLENDSIKSTINNYYTHLNFHLPSFERGAQRNYEKWKDLLLEDGALYIDVSNFSDPLILIKNDIERQALLKDISAGANWRAAGAIQAIDLIDNIISQIDQHLKP